MRRVGVIGFAHSDGAGHSDRVDSSVSSGHTRACTPLIDGRQLGIVAEVTGRRRVRINAYREYLKILGEGAEPHP